MSTHLQRQTDLLFWRHRLASIEEALVGIHAGVVERGRRHDLLAAWHGVDGIVHQLEEELG